MDPGYYFPKGGHEEILSAFAEGGADILVGTQMIVKGHDFPNVTLVGILAADLSLYSSDFRCGERTFQLLTQAAGRAGRGEKPGEVIIRPIARNNTVLRVQQTRIMIAFIPRRWHTARSFIIRRFFSF